MHTQRTALYFFSKIALQSLLQKAIDFTYDEWSGYSSTVLPESSAFTVHLVTGEYLVYEHSSSASLTSQPWSQGHKCDFIEQIISLTV